jgi:hypothetical protein
MRAIRWLIALIVLCCDPLAIALTAAASAIHCLKPHLVRSTSDSCRGDAIERHSACGPIPELLRFRPRWQRCN